MKRVITLSIALIASAAATVVASAQTDIRIKSPQIPILIERYDNVLFYLRADAPAGGVLDHIEIEFGPDTSPDIIKELRLNYSGGEGVQKQGQIHYAPVGYLHRLTPEYTRRANPSYSVPLCETVPGQHHKVTLKADKQMALGVNYFWVSIQTASDAPLLSKIDARISSVYVDGKRNPITSGDEFTTRRLGAGVRYGGDDGAVAYRIPGLVTSNDGTLLAVYDIRHNTGRDLQEYVTIGLSRSRDGGQTWEPMRTIMDFGEYGGMPRAQNGAGDPAILVDRNTGTVWVVALWANGMGNGVCWFNSQAGMDTGTTAQMVMVRSDDNGLTWSEPINVTSQMKDPSWTFFFQGPGCGITMQDGTLVFANQFKDSEGMPHASIMYSHDHGKTWQMNNPARSNTTEAQLVEISPGTLMLNMRDNRGGSRAVSITQDMGQTWTEHPSSRSALPEPVCMASLIKSDDNILARSVLLFSNPSHTNNRTHITIKASLDGGLTWPEDYQIMLDEEEGWGYSCLTMIDRETVGILYESSAAHMVFQTVRLDELVPLND